MGSVRLFERQMSIANNIGSSFPSSVNELLELRRRHIEWRHIRIDALSEGFTCDDGLQRRAVALDQVSRCASRQHQSMKPAISYGTQPGFAESRHIGHDRHPLR